MRKTIVVTNDVDTTPWILVRKLIFYISRRTKKIEEEKRLLINLASFFIFFLIKYKNLNYINNQSKVISSVCLNTNSRSSRQLRQRCYFCNILLVENQFLNKE